MFCLWATLFDVDLLPFFFIRSYLSFYPLLLPPSSILPIVCMCLNRRLLPCPLHSLFFFFISYHSLQPSLIAISPPLPSPQNRPNMPFWHLWVFNKLFPFNSGTILETLCRAMTRARGEMKNWEYQASECKIVAND